MLSSPEMIKAGLMWQQCKDAAGEEETNAVASTSHEAGSRNIEQEELRPRSRSPRRSANIAFFSPCYLHKTRCSVAVQSRPVSVRMLGRSCNTAKRLRIQDGRGSQLVKERSLLIKQGDELHILSVEERHWKKAVSRNNHMIPRRYCKNLV